MFGPQGVPGRFGVEKTGAVIIVRKPLERCVVLTAYLTVPESGWVMYYGNILSDLMSISRLVVPLTPQGCHLMGKVSFYMQNCRPFICVGSKLISGSMKNREGRIWDIFTSRFHIFSKDIRTTSKFWAPEKWRETSLMRSTGKY
jgi:hypothetical protein